LSAIGNAATTRPIALIASGDYGFNLYWQSLSFFAFYFYTDVLRIAPVIAGLILAAGSAVDGLAALLVGFAAAQGGYRAFIRWSAVPLGLSFVALFAPLSPSMPGRVVLVALAQLVFRSLYAVANVPYAALSAQVSNDSRVRARLAGARMLFGTAAALSVAGLIRLFAHSADGRLTAPDGYLSVACFAAIVGTTILLVLAKAAPVSPADRPSRNRWTGTRQLVANRAAVTLVLASMLVTVGGGVLNGSVVYYFADVARAPSAGPVAVGWMSVAGALAIPVLVLLRDRLGTRALWLANAGAAAAITLAFLAAGSRGVAAGIGYFAAMQVVMVGFSFAFWAMLPDTVDWGERRSGVRIEAPTFGAAVLAQKLALGLSSVLLGLLYQRAGYAADHGGAPGTAMSIRAAMIGAPIAGIALSAVAIAANPLRRDRAPRQPARSSKLP
jgi:Na+/melibiose symporter-like transporter